MKTNVIYVKIILSILTICPPVVKAQIRDTCHSLKDNYNFCDLIYSDRYAEPNKVIFDVFAKEKIFSYKDFLCVNLPYDNHGNKTFFNWRSIQTVYINCENGEDELMESLQVFSNLNEHVKPKYCNPKHPRYCEPKWSRNKYINTIIFYNYKGTSLPHIRDFNYLDLFPQLNNIVFVDCPNLNSTQIFKDIRNENLNDLVSLEFYILQDSLRNQAMGNIRLENLFQFAKNEIEINNNYLDIESLHFFGYKYAKDTTLTNEQNDIFFKSLSNLIHLENGTYYYLKNLSYVYIDHCDITNDMMREHWPVPKKSRVFRFFSLKSNRLGLNRKGNTFSHNIPFLPRSLGIDLSYNCLWSESCCDNKIDSIEYFNFNNIKYLFDSNKDGIPRFFYVNNNNLKSEFFNSMIENLNSLTNFNPLSYLDMRENDVDPIETVKIAEECKVHNVFNFVNASQEYESDYKALENEMLNHYNILVRKLNNLLKYQKNDTEYLKDLSKNLEILNNSLPAISRSLIAINDTLRKVDKNPFKTFNVLDFNIYYNQLDSNQFDFNNLFIEINELKYMTGDKYTVKLPHKSNRNVTEDFSFYGERPQIIEFNNKKHINLNLFLFSRMQRTNNFFNNEVNILINKIREALPQIDLTPVQQENITAIKNNLDQLGQFALETEILIKKYNESNIKIQN